jgi:Flp pilus assembly protein TadG
VSGPIDRRRATAQSIVEFALTVPLLLLLIMGVLDVGRGVLAFTTLTNAVREGARAGVVAYPTPGWEAQVATRARSTAPMLDSANLTVAVAVATEGSATFVSVTGQYRFYPIAPYLTMLLAEIPLTSSTRMLTG